MYRCDLLLKTCVGLVEISSRSSEIAYLNTNVYPRARCVMVMNFQPDNHPLQRLFTNFFQHFLPGNQERVLFPRSVSDADAVRARRSRLAFQRLDLDTIGPLLHSL